MFEREKNSGNFKIVKVDIIKCVEKTKERFLSNDTNIIRVLNFLRHVKRVS